MNEEKIRSALRNIPVPEGAEQRMYQNIMKKSQKHRLRASWMLVPLAACLFLMLGMGLKTYQPKPERPSVMVGNPMVQVADPADFAPAGVYMEAPEEAEEITCYMISNRVAKMQFTLKGIAYEYLASGVREDDFSLVSDGTDQEEILGKYQGYLTMSPEGIWKADMILDGGRAFLLNYSGASRDQMVSLMQNFNGKIVK